MTTGSRNDPYRGFNFQVDIEGIVDDGAFSEVSGLSAEGDPVEYREGTDPFNTARKLVALRKFANLTFKRGYVRDVRLWQWYQRIAEGQPERHPVTVTLMDEAREPVMRWTAREAWINKIEGPSLNATGNEVAIESMELCHEGLTLELA